MTVSDYVLDFLSSLNIKKVFLITGGAIAFTVDAFHKRRDISYVCFEHEQAAAMAADAYARVGPGIAATMVTSGPGATNLITGICCSWFDSIPTIHITGQVNTYEQKGDVDVRQVGFQETDIVSMIKPVTKFAVQLDKPENIRYLLEKAVFLATTGRPGPVLIDIPQNFQRVEINKNKLKAFTPPKNATFLDSKKTTTLKALDAIELINKSERPVLLVGGGVKVSKAEKELLDLAVILNIPILTSWSGNDVIPFTHSLRVGNIGVCGDRFANFAVQNSDLLLCIGSRLDTRQTGGKRQNFAREAKKIFIDIDRSEMEKRRGMTADVAIHQDAKYAINILLTLKDKIKKKNYTEWKKTCYQWKVKYPTVKKEYLMEKKVNPYTFMKALSDELDKDAIIIPDDGANLAWTIQGFEVKKGQQLFSAFGNSPMGYSFPAAIGASIALGKKEIICIDGDGSIQMNIQDFQTMVYHQLPIKIFILNNHGYGIIKQFQETWLESRFEATGKGYSAPDFIKVAKAYGIKTVNITSHSELKRKIKQVLSLKMPVVCNVEINEDQKIYPRVEFGKSLENMVPFLNIDELKKNMIVKMIDDQKKVKGEI